MKVQLLFPVNFEGHTSGGNEDTDSVTSYSEL